MDRKIVLITGCSRGIGLGLVKEFSKNGFEIFATCRDPDTAQELQLFLNENGHSRAFSLDVASEASLQNCKADVLAKIDHLDLLINNAGISNSNHPVDPASHCKAEEFDKVHTLKHL